MGASAAGLQEPEPPLFLLRPHHVEATNKEKIYEFYSAEKEKEKSFAENSAAAGQKRGEIINAPSSGGRSEHRKHLH